MAAFLQANNFQNFQTPDPAQLAASSAADRAQRSVFVGNIPYDATEEQLRDVFIQAGPVVSFRLVYDRETGKPKGYGFCEYQDTDTAQSAMRNLNNYDFNGRPLRVGVAAGEQSKDEGKSMQQALGGQVLESPYGEPVEPEKAPEAISKAVASLPPEQMFELMKQMKLCIQNNPNEARNMLLQNPQLAYALLQAQIVMKIVDPQVAMSMLYRDETQPQITLDTTASGNRIPLNQLQQGMGPRGPPVVPAPRMNMGVNLGMTPMSAPPRPDMMLMHPGAPRGDMGEMRFPQAGNMPGMIPNQRLPGVPGMNPRPVQPPNPVSSTPNVPGPSGASPATNGSQNISIQDQEKAALIMQVLQLTDEEIADLPPEQRQSILILKEQIKSG